MSQSILFMAQQYAQYSITLTKAVVVQCRHTVCCVLLNQLMIENSWIDWLWDY